MRKQQARGGEEELEDKRAVVREERIILWKKLEVEAKQNKELKEEDGMQNQFFAFS